ncbi:MAG: FAD:protein FMN transferase [Candidatus Rokubacteria bacterium]|nr:FAD:protein FMN transferase [Candidatus Rokubacteria bacterium]
MRVNRRRFLAGLGGGLGGMLLALRAPGGAAERAEPRTAVIGRLMLGTLVETEASHESVAAARDALRAGFDRIDDVDRLMSVFHDSEVTRLARGAGAEAAALSEDTYRVLAEARAVAAVTRGALDVTILPLMRLWTAAAESGRVPSRAELDATARLVGVDGLVLDARARTARLTAPGAGVDLGGIGKGYAVDVATDALRARGVRSGIVNAGGDLRVLGRGPGGTPWRIGLRHPLRPESLLLALSIEDEAVCTSGNYFRYFTVAGRHYGHVLDPRRGTPAETALSATVVASQAMRADGLATGALVCGVHGALDVMAAAGVDGVVVSEWKGHPGGVVAHVTRGLAGRVELLDPTAVVSA